MNISANTDEIIMGNLIVNGNIYCGDDAYFLDKSKVDKTDKQVFGDVEVKSDLYINCKVESDDYILFQDLNKLEKFNIKPGVNIENFNGTIIDAKKLTVTGNIITSKNVYIFSDKLHNKLRLEKVKKLKEKINI